MYNNVGKRDILIFPKFKNINIINNIRKQYDRLANLVAPHITVVFPFKADISNEELIKDISFLLKRYSPFEVTFKGVTLSPDNYVLLNCIKGNEKLIELHDELYKKIMPNHLKKYISYAPHITLGQFETLEPFNNFNYEFTTLVDELSIELIGENEESIIIENIKLRK